jgi:hypothetical protein
MNEVRYDERLKDNTREIHECDGRTHNPDTMVSPLTPKPTHKTEGLVSVSWTIVLYLEGDIELRKWTLSTSRESATNHRQQII